MNLRKVSEEVFIADDSIVRLGDAEIALLKRQAQASPRQRARICSHKSNDDALHEMVIALAAASYIQPHRHIDKSESFHIIEGEVDVVIFDQAGAIADVVEMGPLGSGRCFYYRLSESIFHTLLLRTQVLVIHEVTNGPFALEKTVFAPFAPAEDQADRARDYMQELGSRVKDYLEGAKV